MKKFTLAGFGIYSILNNRTVILNETGEEMTQNKKEKKAGTITLTASEDADEIVKGNAYEFTFDDLMTAGEGSWEDVAEIDAPAPSTPEDTAPKETSASDAAKEAKKAERKKLKDAVNKAQTALFTAVPGDGKLEAYQAAVKAYNDFTATAEKAPARVFTADEQVIIDEFEGKVKVWEQMKNEAAALREHLESMEVPADYKKKFGGKTTAGEDVPQRAAKDLDAQQIRREYAVGRYGNPGEQESIKSIADRHGCNPQSVNFIVNYISHKLKKGDEVIVPLVNKYYPELNSPFNNTRTNGAPYVEDGVVELHSKYTQAESRKYPSVNWPDAATNEDGAE